LNPSVSLAQVPYKDEPIDRLDILAIEPHLFAQAILDNQRESGEITLSRDILARMLEAFDCIVAEGLDVPCTA
jgi:hypothetical protein